jgi:hypothetical protein
MTERPTVTTSAGSPVADNRILRGLLQLRNKYERPLATIQRAARAL